MIAALTPLVLQIGCGEATESSHENTTASCTADLEASKRQIAAQQKRLQDADRRYAQLKAENDSLRAKVNDLANAPPQLLRQALHARSDGDLEKAAEFSTKLLADFPASAEAAEARSVLTAVEAEKARRDKEEQARREAEEKARKLGLKGLKPTRSFAVKTVTFTLDDASVKRRWVFDRAGIQVSYQEPTKGNTFVVADFSISTSDMSARLPQILVYRSTDDGVLQYQCRMGIQFYRWTDYGSYLGNYGDYRNDFAHSDTIRFSGACAVEESVCRSNALFIVVGNTPCFTRRSEQFRNPPVFYAADNCPSIPYKLDISTIDAHVQLAAVLNRRRL